MTWAFFCRNRSGMGGTGDAGIDPYTLASYTLVWIWLNWTWPWTWPKPDWRFSPPIRAITGIAPNTQWPPTGCSCHGSGQPLNACVHACDNLSRKSCTPIWTGHDAHQRPERNCWVSCIISPLFSIPTDGQRTCLRTAHPLVAGSVPAKLYLVFLALKLISPPCKASGLVAQQRQIQRMDK